MKTLLALILKELRERSKCALLAIVLFTLPLIYANATGPYTSYDMATEPVLGHTYTTTMRFAPAIIAIILGLLITLPESKADAWAFFLHRPVSPNRLFWGKFLGGLLLYSLSTLIPLAIFLAWTASPGGMAAPFAWPMILPGLAALFAGAVYLPAAMAVGLSNAPWYTSRTLPLGIAIAASIAVAFAREFSHALLYALPFFIIAALAARALFLQNANAQIKPTDAAIGRVAHALTLLPALWLILFFLANHTARYSWEKPTPTSPDTRYCFAHDGRLILQKSLSTQFTLLTLDGDKIAQWDTNLSPEEFNKHALSGLSALYVQPRKDVPPSYNATPRFFHRTVGMGRDIWYHLPSNNTLVGYRPRERRYLGAATPHGFTTPADPSPTPFTGNFIGVLNDSGSCSHQQVTFSTGIYLFDFDNLKFEKPVFLCPPGEKILCATSSLALLENQNQDIGQPYTDYAVLTNRRFIYFTPDNQIAFQADISSALPPGHPPIENVMPYRFGDRLVLVHTPQGTSDFFHSPSLINIDMKTGKVTSTFTPPPLPPYVPPQEFTPYILLGSLLGPPSLSFSLIPDALNRTPLYARSFLPWITLSSTLSLIACIPLALRRKTSTAMLVLWSAAALFLGFPALVLMALVASAKPHTPLLPAPRPNGTEVFASLAPNP